MDLGGDYSREERARERERERAREASPKASKLGKMTGMSPSHTARARSLARCSAQSFRGETAINSKVASTSRKESRNLARKSRPNPSETDIFVVISCDDYESTTATILARRQNNFPQGAERVREGERERV